MSSLNVLCFLICVIGVCAFKLESRIINGEDVTDADNTSYIVSLRTTLASVFETLGLQQSGSGHFCGGSIISPSYILTAAHCVTDPSFKVLPALSLYAIAGIKNLDGTGTRITITKVTQHENWDETTLSNDIAAFKTISAISFTNTVNSIGLPNSLGDVPTGNVNLLAIGWGIYSTSANTLPNRLQKANLQFISLSECMSEYAFCGLDGEIANNNNICTMQSNKGVCNGDSGGPIV